MVYQKGRIQCEEEDYEPVVENPGHERESLGCRVER
jgi:hypothetical protein